MPPLSVLMKPASGLCNMKCDYCFYCDEICKRSQENYGYMAEGTLKNVIRKTILRAEGSVMYTFQGGEPTLRGIDFFKRAVDYQKQYNKNGVRVENAFQTNGFLLDEDWCRFLKENHFLVGVSLDGTEKTHNRYRHTAGGAESYDRVLRAVSLLEKYDVPFNILTVVTAETAKNIGEIYRDYMEHGWMYQQYIACLDPLDEPHGANSYAITPRQYGTFLIALFELWFGDWKKRRQPYIRQFENYVGILLGYQPEACDQRGSCGIQTVVEANGSVYPCDFYMLDEYRLGNFNTDRLETIDRRREEIGFIERSGKLSAACRDCKYFKICRGGCQRNRDHIEKTGLYENYFCEGYRMFFDACLEKMEYIAKNTLQERSRRKNREDAIS